MIGGGREFGGLRPVPFSFSVFLLFLDVCSDPQCLSADVKQRTTGMHCQMETLVYLRDTAGDLA